MLLLTPIRSISISLAASLNQNPSHYTVLQIQPRIYISHLALTLNKVRALKCEKWGSIKAYQQVYFPHIKYNYIL